MPKELEEKLKRQARKYLKQGKLKKKKGESSQQAIDRYVYGTLRKTGWVPRQQKKR